MILAIIFHSQFLSGLIIADQDESRRRLKCKILYICHLIRKRFFNDEHLELMGAVYLLLYQIQVVGQLDLFSTNALLIMKVTYWTCKWLRIFPRTFFQPTKLPVPNFTLPLVDMFQWWVITNIRWEIWWNINLASIIQTNKSWNFRLKNNLTQINS